MYNILLATKINKGDELSEYTYRGQQVSGTSFRGPVVWEQLSEGQLIQCEKYEGTSKMQ